MSSVPQQEAMMQHNEEETTAAASSFAPEQPIETNGGEEEEGEEHIEPAEEPEIEVPKWSQVLSSTALGAPAALQGKQGNGQGMPLQLATDRAKKLVRCGRLVATLLHDISGHYDTFGQALLKSTQGLSVRAADVNNSATTATSSSSSSSSCSDGSGTPAHHQQTMKLILAAKLLETVAQHNRAVFTQAKATVTKPLHTSMQSMGETVPNIYQRYSTMQSKINSCRSVALRARAKYVKAVQDAESVYRETNLDIYDDNNDDDGNGNNSCCSSYSSDWESNLRQCAQRQNIVVDPLIAKLKEVQQLENRYVELVKDENATVSQCITMEAMALESMQQLESHRLTMFVDSLSKFADIVQRTMQDMELTLDPEHVLQHLQHTKPDAKPGEKNNANEFFKNLLKPVSLQSEDVVGVMEAATIGLPDEAGTLRDDIATAIQANEKRMAAVRSVATCLEDVASASSTFATSLSNRLRQEGFVGNGRAPQIECLAVLLEGNEGPNAAAYCHALVRSIEKIIQSCQKLAKTLRDVRHEKLDSYMLTGERQLKASSEADEGRWKQLCEYARQENKAETRYSTSTSEHEKARVRVKSLDAGPNRERTGSLTPKMPPGMGKAIGNVMSILPNRGEHAMKIMSPDARRMVAQNTLDEADLRSSKHKEAWEQAKRSKEAALQIYTESGQTLLKKLLAEEENGWKDLGAALEMMTASLQDYRQRHLDAMTTTVGKGPSKNDRAKDMLQWTESTSKKLGADSPATNSQSGYVSTLSVLLVHSSINKLTTAPEGNVNLAPKINGVDRTPTKAATRGTHVNAEVDLHLPELRTPQREGSTTVSVMTPSLLNELASPPKNGGPLRQMAVATNDDLGVILANFLSDQNGEERLSSVITSFACAYWPKEAEGFMSRIIYGRLFITKLSFYFVEWGGKKLILDWTSFTDIEHEKCLFGEDDNALRISCSRDGKGKTYFFGSFWERDEAVSILNRSSEEAKIAAEEAAKRAAEEAAAATTTTTTTKTARDGSAATTGREVSPDPTIKKMEMLLVRKIPSVSIQKYYDCVWAEGEGADAPAFYGPVLEEMGSMKVSVGKWQVGSFKNPWCGEDYQRKRSIGFEFKRTTHLYVGPPIAVVRQTQYCRLEGNDRCVLQTVGEFEGIPYADCFAVEVRWTASREGANDVKVEVGVFVNFKKSTMFAKQIRSGTIVETKPIHEKLFAKAVKACTGSETKVEEVVTEVITEGQEDVGGDSIVDKLQAGFGQALRLALEGDPLILGVGFLLLIILARWCLIPRASKITAEQQLMAEILILRQKMEEMQAEIKSMHTTLQQVVSKSSGT